MPPMPRACADSHSLIIWSTESWKLPGMEEISLRTPSPGTTNNGRMNCDGARWVSRTSRRIDSETRSRRLRWMGKDMLLLLCPLWGSLQVFADEVLQVADAFVLLIKPLRNAADFHFCAAVDFEIHLAADPVLFVLAVLAHHDDGSLNGGEHGEKEIQK